LLLLLLPLLLLSGISMPVIQLWLSRKRISMGDLAELGAVASRGIVELAENSSTSLIGKEISE